MRNAPRPPAPWRATGLGLSAVLLGPLLAAVVVTLTPVAAHATSCVAIHPDAASAIARGSGPIGDGQTSGAERFRDDFDGLVLGTVLDAGARADRPVDVVVQVLGGLGPRLPDEVTLTSPDPGLMFGYGFVEGETYAVPYRLEHGERASFVCDPITVVGPEDVDRLVAVAQDGAWPGEAWVTSTPAADPAAAAGPAGTRPAAVDAGGAGEPGGPGPAVVAGALGATLVVTGTLLAAGRRRRR